LSANGYEASRALQEDIDFRRKCARCVSVLCNPLVIGVPVVVAIGMHEHGGFQPRYLLPTVVSIFIMCILPLTYTLMLVRKGIIGNFHISDRRQRIYLFSCTPRVFCPGGSDYLSYSGGKPAHTCLAWLRTD